MKRGSRDGLMSWAVVLFTALNVFVFAVAWLGGTVGAAVSGAGWHPPRFGLATYGAILTGNADRVWPGADPVWAYAGIVYVLLLVLTPAVIVLYKLYGRRAKPKKMAQRPEPEAQRPEPEAGGLEDLGAYAADPAPALNGPPRCCPWARPPTCSATLTCPVPSCGIPPGTSSST